MYKKNIHICIIKRKFRDTGGIKNKIIEEIRICNDLGYEPFVLVETEGAKFNNLCYKVVKCGFPLKGSMFSWVFKMRARRWLKINKPDIVISHNDMPSDDIVHVHNCVHMHHEKVYGLPLPESNRHGKKHNEIYSNRTCRLFVANSRITKNDLVQRHGVPVKNIAVVYPELDLEKFNGSNHESKRLAGRKMLGLGENEQVIGLVTSGDFAKRNASFYMAILASIIQKYPTLKGVLVGKDKFDTYLVQAAKLGIKDNFIAKSVVAEVENIYHALDVTLLPAHHEEFGYVVAESIACGTPCIVSDGVGAGELYIDAGMEDMVLPLGDAKLWADKVLQLLENKAYRQMVVGKGLEISQSYTKENAEKYRQLLKQAIASKVGLS